MDDTEKIFQHVWFFPLPTLIGSNWADHWEEDRKVEKKYLIKVKLLCYSNKTGIT